MFCPRCKKNTEETVCACGYDLSRNYRELPSLSGILPEDLNQKPLSQAEQLLAAQAQLKTATATILRLRQQLQETNQSLEAAYETIRRLKTAELELEKLRKSGKYLPTDTPAASRQKKKPSSVSLQKPGFFTRLYFGKAASREVKATRITGTAALIASLIPAFLGNPFMLLLIFLILPMQIHILRTGLPPFPCVLGPEGHPPRLGKMGKSLLLTLTCLGILGCALGLMTDPMFFFSFLSLTLTFLYGYLFLTLKNAPSPIKKS